MTELELLAQHVSEGLAAPQKALSPAWFYDDEGSRLFQQIMALPEYYLTRAEHALLEARGDELAALIDPAGQPLDLVELGSGDGSKMLGLLGRLRARNPGTVYRPVDLSEHALTELARRFGEQLPELTLAPVRGDYFNAWPPAGAGRRQVALYMGSNLGNQDHQGALSLLRRIRGKLRPGDALVLGLDMVKDPRVILAAYHDSQGVTARFNLNLLARLNRELGMDFALDRFAHYACYNPLDGAARSFLVSALTQEVHSSHLGRSFHFAAGETIYTEQSQKYTPAMVQALAEQSGFEPAGLLLDEAGWYGLAFWRVADKG